MLRHAGGNFESFAPTDEPVEKGADHDGSENGRGVVHRGRCDGERDREGQEDDDEDSKCQSGHVDGDAPHAESEGPVGWVSAL